MNEHESILDANVTHVPSCDMDAKEDKPRPGESRRNIGQNSDFGDRSAF